MSYKTILCGVVLVCLASEGFAAVGDPTGTSYGISGRNHGHSDGGHGAGTFGSDLFYATEYLLPPDLTGDDQLAPGGGAPLPLTFDGVAETFGNLEFNESHQIYDGSGIHLYSEFYGISKAAAEAAPPLPLGWDTPGHLIEFSIKDTTGGANNFGGTLDDFFSPSVTRYDDVTPDGTTGGANAAVPVFAADRPPVDPSLAPLGLDGRWVGSYFYFKKDGMPINPIPLEEFFPEAVLGSSHPNIPGQEMFFIIFQYDYFDFFATHDIGAGTFGASWDLSLIGANFVTLASSMNFLDAGEIDEVVMGYIYRMIADSDGNEDGLVDGLDYLTWAANFGTVPLNPGAPDTIVPAPGRTYGQHFGDYNSDGIVDGLDYLVWASEFGFVGDGSDMIGTAVPEPSSLMGLATGLMALCGLVRRRSRG